MKNHFPLMKNDFPLMENHFPLMKNIDFMTLWNPIEYEYKTLFF